MNLPWEYMESSQSLSVLVKRLDSDVRQILRKVNFGELSSKNRELLSDLQQDLVDARIYSNAYELSETREDQLDNAKRAKSWLNKAKKCILTASEHNIFEAIDVAHLSANIEQIIDKLE
ncbi:MAG TPA: hypothetical protein VFT49_02965 [Candidatus Saccharimonadales bacterium]|nr:hypothetical protein [Candidatus Saccharimonadales bacterium]